VDRQTGLEKSGAHGAAIKVYLNRNVGTTRKSQKMPRPAHLSKNRPKKGESEKSETQSGRGAQEVGRRSKVLEIGCRRKLKKKVLQKVNQGGKGKKKIAQLGREEGQGGGGRRT